ncbi:hypothetical protein JR316_0006329 [Psilocybe cubensis]|uniref:Uncharacterized protein n=2 Tax=Psilocybe cubensis TaxID=181762 RepID=A0A8H7Y3T8_PSICU|nr:hypothetical protein JR316_0006329 [Psilocybe cubensis]KAH9481802.1 hypothetical protein JR316_0006329 [Psilocybe cubensis]
MFSFNKILNLAFIALNGALIAAAAPASQTLSCFPPAAGNYSFESVAFPGELVGVGQGFVPVIEKAPPQGNLGVWTLTTADQGGYHIMNVELMETVTTVHLVESNLFLPTVSSAPATTYAIECAGANGPQYVIKAVDDDLLWETIPGTRDGDAQQGVANVEMHPADGSDEQRFLLHAL